MKGLPYAFFSPSSEAHVQTLIACVSDAIRQQESTASSNDRYQ